MKATLLVLMIAGQPYPTCIFCLRDGGNGAFVILLITSLPTWDGLRDFDKHTRASGCTHLVMVIISRSKNGFDCTNASSITDAGTRTNIKTVQNLAE